jgi:hypothetical protein
LIVHLFPCTSYPWAKVDGNEVFSARNKPVYTLLFPLLLGAQELSDIMDLSETADGSTIQSNTENSSDSPAGQEARKALLLTEIDPNSSFSREQRQIISESLLLQLQKNIDSVVFIVPIPAEEQAETTSDLAEFFRAAQMNGADTIVRAQISGSMENIQLQFRIWNVFSQAETGSFSMDGKIDSRYRNIFGGFWYPALQALELLLEPIINIASINIQARPDTRILIHRQDQEALQQTIAGEQAAVFELPIPANYRLTALLPGYFEEERAFFLDADQTIDLREEQEELNHWFVQPGLRMLSFPSVHGGILLLNSQLAIRLGITSYMIGLQPFEHSHDDWEEQSLVESLPLNTLEAGVFWHFRSLRLPLGMSPYAGLGAALRILTSPSFMVDLLYPVEIRPEAGLQFPLSRRFSVSASLALPFIIASDGDFAERQNLEDAGAIGLLPWLYMRVYPILHAGVQIGW